MAYLGKVNLREERPNLGSNVKEKINSRQGGIAILASSVVLLMLVGVLLSK